MSTGSQGPRLLALFGELDPRQAFLDPREIGEHVLALLSAIDLEQPRVDRDKAGDRLRAYVRALGLGEPRVRWVRDLRALREARMGNDRGDSPSLSGRQAQIFAERRWRRRAIEGWPRAARLADVDRTVLRVGLGTSDQVVPVRRVAPNLCSCAAELASGAAPPRRAAALIALAESAAAGLCAYAVGKGNDLIAVARPHLSFDSQGRLHAWDGSPAVDWPGGRGLYFWNGVHMTESAGRRPDALTPSRILEWTNAERRRVAIERIGLERFMRAAGAEITHRDDYGSLLAHLESRRSRTLRRGRGR